MQGGFSSMIEKGFYTEFGELRQRGVIDIYICIYLGISIYIYICINHTPGLYWPYILL